MHRENKEDSIYADRWNTADIIIALAVICFYIGITWYGSSGVRGTDDYWYVADVQSLINGHGIQTNNIFPVSLINGIPKLPRPFVHNTLNVYLAAIPAMVFGAYKGWIVTNILSSLLTSYIIYIIVKRISGHKPALMGALVYLIMPLTLLQSIKPMAEASIAPIVALLILVYMNDDKKYTEWLLLMILSGLLIFCRVSFLPVLLIIPFLYLLEKRKLDRRTLCYMLVLMFTGFVFLKMNGILFKANASFSYLQIVNSAVPNKSNNMNLYFNLHPDKITFVDALGNIKAKAIEGLRIQFIPSNIPSDRLNFKKYYLPFNLMFIASILMLYKYKNRKYLKISFIALFFYVLHLITIVLFQNQDRYMLVSLPIMIIGATVFLGSFKWFEVSKKYVAPIIVIIGLIIFMPLNVSKAKAYSEDITYYEKAYKDVGNVFEKVIPTTDTVIVEAEAPWQYLMKGYMLRPRRVLFVLDSYTINEYNVLIKNSKAKWMICRKDSLLVDKIKNRVGESNSKLPAPFENYIIYQIIN